MNREAVAKELILVAKELTADRDACADLIINSTNQVRRLMRKASAIQDAFESARRQLTGMKQYGAGATEADTLLKNVVLPKLYDLQNMVNDMDSSIRDAVREKVRGGNS